MPFTDEQFVKLIDSIGENKKQWELLIRIDENTKNHSKELNAHAADDIAKFALSKQSTDALHMRLDKVKNDLELQRDLVKKDFDRAIAWQNKMMGAIAVLVFAVPIAIAFVKR